MRTKKVPNGTRDVRQVPKNMAAWTETFVRGVILRAPGRGSLSGSQPTFGTQAGPDTQEAPGADTTLLIEADCLLQWVAAFLDRQAAQASISEATTRIGEGGRGVPPLFPGVCDPTKMSLPDDFGVADAQGYLAGAMRRVEDVITKNGGTIP